MQDYQTIEDGSDGDQLLSDFMNGLTTYSQVLAETQSWQGAITGHSNSYIGASNQGAVDDEDTWLQTLPGGLQTISLLPDLARLANTSGFNGLVSESNISLQVHRVVQHTTTTTYFQDGDNNRKAGDVVKSEKITFNSLIDSIQTKTDTIAKSLFPNSPLLGVDPYFTQLQVDATPVSEKMTHENYDFSSGALISRSESTTLYTSQFLITVVGNAADFSLNYAGLPWCQKDAGRFLITLDNPTGQRAENWGEDWINIIDKTTAPGVFNNLNFSDPATTLPAELLPTEIANTGELISTHIDYAKDATGKVVFTEESNQYFTGRSMDYVTALQGSISSYLYKQAAFMALGAIYGPAGWIADLKTVWDVGSVMRPVLKTSCNALMYDLGMSSTPVSSTEYQNAWMETILNATASLAANSFGNLPAVSNATDSDIAKILIKAGIKGFGAGILRETNSFTFSSFEWQDGQSYLSINGDGKRDFATGSYFNDSIRGFAGNDHLYGMTGNDTLNGGEGNDTLVGGIGVDSMYGGLGNDTYYVDHASDYIAESSDRTNGGFDTVISSVSYTLGNYQEKLDLSGPTAIIGNGNALTNILIGSIAGNVLNGGSGIDSMYGGLGNDTYYVDHASDYIAESSDSLNGGIDTVISSVTRTLGNYQENLTLSGSAAINGIGNTLANKLVGNSAANALNGGSGIDSMYGGLGNDTYYVDHASDYIAESSDSLNGGIDTVISSVTRTLGNYQENLTLSGSAAINGTGNALNNVMTGNTGNNTLNGGDGNDKTDGGTGNDTLLGGNGNDTLVGGAGTDSMNGGAGNDTYYVDASTDVITGETSTSGIDSVRSAINYTLGSTSNLENLTLLTGATFGTGNALNNVLSGNTGNNTLNGGAGNDVLIGGAGKDSLTGGTGADRFDFNALLEILTGTSRDVISDFKTAEGDKIDLSTLDANTTTTATNEAFSYIGGNAFTQAGQLRLVNGILFGNTDADSTAEFEIQLTGVSSLTSTAFVL